MTADLFDVVTPSHDEPSLDRLRALLADGADLAARDEHGATPLHRAVQAPYTEDEPLPSLDVARMLLAAGADVHAVDGIGVTPAERAVLDNDTMPAAAIDRSVAMLALLVDHGALLDGPVSNVSGGSFAHHSCAPPAVYAFLLDHGAPTSVADDNGDSPLHATVQSGRTALVELLVGRGVDTGAVNQLGLTPLGVAQHLPRYSDQQRRIRSDIIAVLEAAGAPAQVDYPVVDGGPLPIDMDAIRGAAADGLERFAVRTYGSYQHFIDDVMASSCEVFPALLRACRSTLAAATVRTMEGDQTLSRPFFHHGDLVVRGSLHVQSRFLVTGALTVEGCLMDAGPDSRIAVGADLRARGVHTDGELYVEGDLDADVVYGHYNDFTLTADTIRGRLVVEDEHCVAADVEAEHHFDLDTYEQGYGDGVQERLRAVLVDEVFDGEEMLDHYALFDLLRDGRPVFRSDAVAGTE